MERVYRSVNNGVYRCGFAGTQDAYEAAYDQLFAGLDWLSHRLADRRYLMGDAITEADVRLFTTLVRFDAVYHGHFKCNRQKLTEMPVLWSYARDLFQTPGFGDTVDFVHIKRHYYVVHHDVNPTGIVPKGPLLEEWATPARPGPARRSAVRQRYGARAGADRARWFRRSTTRRWRFSRGLRLDPVHEADDPVEVVDRGELHGELPLALAEGDRHPGVVAVGQPRGQVVQLRVPVPRAGSAGPRDGRRVVATHGDDLLDAAHRESFGDDPLGEPLHGRTVVQAEQGPGVPGGEDAGRETPGDERGEPEQPQRVGDLWPRPADAGGQLLVRAPEVVEQLLVGGSLLERVQLAAVQVLQERVPQQVVVVGLLDDRRDRVAGPRAGWRAAGARP